MARLVISAFHGLRPEHKLRVIAPDVGGGFGSKIFIYAEEVVCLWASKRVGGRPVKWTAERTESFLADAHGRDHVTHAELAMDARTARSPALQGPHHRRRWAPISRPSPPACRPISMRRCCRASTTSRTIYAEVDAVYTNTAPVDAYRGAGRPEATYVVERIVETAARETEDGSGGVPPPELRHRVPASDAGHHVLRRRRL